MRLSILSRAAVVSAAMAVLASSVVRAQQPADSTTAQLTRVGGDRFVRRGAPRGERFFARDASGRVTSMVDRRDNLDLVWRRVAPARP